MAEIFVPLPPNANRPAVINNHKVNLGSISLYNRNLGTLANSRFHNLPENFRFRTQDISSDYSVTSLDPRSEAFIRSLNVSEFRKVVKFKDYSLDIVSSKVNPTPFGIDATRCIFGKTLPDFIPTFLNKKYSEVKNYLNLKACHNPVHGFHPQTGAETDKTFFSGVIWRGIPEIDYMVDIYKFMKDAGDVVAGVKFSEAISTLICVGLVTDKISNVGNWGVNQNIKNHIAKDESDELGVRLINYYEAIPNNLVCLSYITYNVKNPNLNYVVHLWFDYFISQAGNFHSADPVHYSPVFSYGGLPLALNNIATNDFGIYHDIDGSSYLVRDVDSDRFIVQLNHNFVYSNVSIGMGLSSTSHLGDAFDLAAGWMSRISFSQSNRAKAYESLVDRLDILHPTAYSSNVIKYIADCYVKSKQLRYISPDPSNARSQQVITDTFEASFTLDRHLSRQLQEIKSAAFASKVRKNVELVVSSSNKQRVDVFEKLGASPILRSLFV